MYVQTLANADIYICVKLQNKVTTLIWSIESTILVLGFETQSLNLKVYSLMWAKYLKNLFHSRSLLTQKFEKSANQGSLSQKIKRQTFILEIEAGLNWYYDKFSNCSYTIYILLTTNSRSWARKTWKKETFKLRLAVREMNFSFLCCRWNVFELKCLFPLNCSLLPPYL